MISVGQVLTPVPEDADLTVSGSGQRGSSTWDGLHAVATPSRTVSVPHPRASKVVGRATGVYRIG
jgi:hypothetical protein